MPKAFPSVLLLLSLLMTSPWVRADALLDQADQLIATGEHRAAWQLLQPLEDQRAGEVEFDFRLGVAAVESGQVTRGVFALERVLAQQPDHAAARVEIAKAYFLLGEVDTAKTEFNYLLQARPATPVATAINRYMNAIDKSLGLTTTFAAYLDFGIGHDSNVSSATSASSIALPGISAGALFTLSPQARERSDNFTSLSAGISVRQPVTKTLAVFAAINGSQRMNATDTPFDTSYLDFNGGFKYRKFTDTVTAALQASTFALDGQRFRNSVGTTLQWQHDVNERNQGNVYLQYARLSYAGNAFRDADRYVIGGGWAHVFAGDRSPLLFAGAYLGTEHARDNTADFLSNRIYGLRSGGQLAFNSRWVGYSTLSYERRDYEATDPFFARTRQDDQYDLAVGLRFLPGHDWVINPQISYLRNDSNIALNEFDRTVFSVNFRHDFKW